MSFRRMFRAFWVPGSGYNVYCWVGQTWECGVPPYRLQEFCARHSRREHRL